MDSEAGMLDRALATGSGHADAHRDSGKEEPCRGVPPERYRLERAAAPPFHHGVDESREGDASGHAPGPCRDAPHGPAVAATAARPGSGARWEDVKPWSDRRDRGGPPCALRSLQRT